MRTLILSISGLFLLTPMACGGGSGLGSPKAAAETLVAAMTSGDGDKAVSVLPPQEALEAYFDCGGEGGVIERIAKRRERMRKEAAGMKAEKVEMSVGAFDLEGSETKTYKIGEEFKGCKLKQDLEVHTAKLTLRVKEGDAAPKDDGETWTFLKLGDSWFFTK